LHPTVNPTGNAIATATMTNPKASSSQKNIALLPHILLLASGILAFTPFSVKYDPDLSLRMMLEVERVLERLPPLD